MIKALAVRGAQIGVIWALLASNAWAQTPEPEPAPPELKTCFKCHGPGGVSQIPTHPSIAGQNPNYIVKQLWAFRRAHEATTKAAQEANVNAQNGQAVSPDPVRAVSRGRSDPIMGHIGASMDETRFGTLANAISKLPCDGKAEPDPVVKKEKRPQRPDAVKPCVGCHGSFGIAHMASVPNLAGQQRAYLRRELLLLRASAWNDTDDAAGSWRNHPIMEKQSSRLRIEDVDAIANYYARLNCRGYK